jgi:hypothetical protein
MLHLDLSIRVTRAMQAYNLQRSSSIIYKGQIWQGSGYCHLAFISVFWEAQRFTATQHFAFLCWQAY